MSYGLKIRVSLVRIPLAPQKELAEIRVLFFIPPPHLAYIYTVIGLLYPYLYSVDNIRAVL